MVPCDHPQDNQRDVVYSTLGPADRSRKSKLSSIKTFLVSATMIFAILETTYTNQNGQVVAVKRQTGIGRPLPT